MESILNKEQSIHFNLECYTVLNQTIRDSNFSKIFLIVDTNTHELCLPKVLPLIETTLDIEIIEIECGEINKTIETCVGVWNALSELGADRKSLIINIGGGVVTDLGGFVASTYRRGISFINVPTTLLSMVDASVGGKTGVDLGILKNQIGVINTPEMVLVDTSFLDTLPHNEMRSGMAEMLKHGLISDEIYWDKMIHAFDNSIFALDQLIYESIIIKHEIVTIDPTEIGLRKTLNFGHTLGHAIESYYLSHPKKSNLLHGEAVAIGMVLACYISSILVNFPKDKRDSIKSKINKIYGKVNIDVTDFNDIISLLIFDKKNSYGDINFVLLRDIGKTVIDCKVDNSTIIDAFNYYLN